MQQEFKVYITETVTRPVWVEAETPAEAQLIAEENYNEQDVVDVSFEVDPTSRRYLWERNRGTEPMKIFPVTVTEAHRRQDG
jgi:hypothetical protein